MQGHIISAASTESRNKLSLNMLHVSLEFNEWITIGADCPGDYRALFAAGIAKTEA
jgi:hypothetical protein